MVRLKVCGSECVQVECRAAWCRLVYANGPKARSGKWRYGVRTVVQVRDGVVVS